MDKKNVAHNTRIVRDSDGDGIILTFHKHPLIRWEKEGHIALSNCDFWTTTTQQRLNQFMPTDFRVWQRRPYWFLSTPTGVRPWQNEMEIDYNGKTYGSFHPEVSRGNAHELWDEVEAFAKAYVARLLRGMMSSPLRGEDASRDCMTCTHSANIENATQPSDHVVRHLKEGDANGYLILAAVTAADKSLRGGTKGLESRASTTGTPKGMQLPRQAIRDAVLACWSGSRELLLKPRSKRELVEQTEKRMTMALEDMPREDIKPRAFSWNLRRLLADYMLDSLDFQRMK